MSSAQPLHQIKLAFRPDDTTVVKDLSAVRCIGDYLWLGSDEGCTIERLTLGEDTATEHQTFRVQDFLDLPGAESQEIDIEGLAYADHYLWIVGSHSLKRKKPEPGSSPEDMEKRLKTISCEENRYLLGRIPLVDGQLFRRCPHPEAANQELTAARIKPRKTGNHLTHALKQDPHLGAYLKAKLPGKENGFDIEGIAVSGSQVFLGLRGPVLRGWAILLELMPKDKEPGFLKLKTIEGNCCYRKHFLNLQGMGIRDLCWSNNDLLILAGPTMDIAGLATIYRIPNAVEVLANEKFLQPDSLMAVLDSRDSDKAEGFSLLSPHSEKLLIVYDCPSRDRVEHNSVKADVFALPSPD